MLTFTFRYFVDLASVVLALLSMRVKVDVLSDGKYVMAIVFTTIINKTLIFILLVITQPYANAMYTFTCLAILVYAFTVLLLTFIPKVSCFMPLLLFS